METVPRFSRFSIKQKLTTIILLTSSIVLLVAFAAFAIYDFVTARRKLIADLSIIADGLGINSAAALSFDVPGSGEDILRSLRAQPRIMAGIIFDANGIVFARYHRADLAVSTSDPPLQPGGHVFRDDSLRLYKQIEQNHEKLGTVFLESDLEDLRARRHRLIQFATATAAACLPLAFLLTRRLQRQVSGPILHLAEIEQRVWQEQDFSIRAVKRSSDELGLLIDGFNLMLQQIQARDAELTVAKDLAEEANRTKSGFLANMSHELRTPLNAILGYSEMLIEDAPDAGHEEIVPDLKRIHAAGKHLLALINDILDLSKIEAGKMDLVFETFTLRPIVDDVITTVQPLLEKNQNTLRLDYAADIGEVRADVTRMRQILFNLLSNASKFTERGMITLTLKREIVDDAGSIVLSVEDSGIGMTQEQMGRLFQAFSQADAQTTKKYGGTGLGLVICRRLSRMMGGDITVESTAGVGSTFTVRLPIAIGPSRPSSPPPARGDADAAPLVLVVEEASEERDRMVDALQREGIRTAVSADPVEAVAIACELNPSVITIDVEVPELHGWAVLASLRKEPATAAVPLVLITTPNHDHMAAAVGAVGCVSKPVDADRLVGVLTTYLAVESRRLVLVVDDDEHTRQMLRRVLEREGCTVIEAEHGVAALARLERTTPGLILLDLMMPEMDGFEVIAALRDDPRWQGIPVVLITSKDLNAADRQKLSGQVRGIIAKGANAREAVIGEVRRLIGQKVPSTVVH